MSDRPTVSGPWAGLRLAATVAVVCGQLAAVAAAVLPVVALLVTVPLTVVGAVVSSRASERSAARLRTAATLVALGLALAVLPQLLSGGGAAGIRGVLGPLLVGVSVSQAWTWSRRRELCVAVLGAVGLLVLGASFAPDVLIGLPLLVGWVAAVVGVVLADRERASEGVDLVLRGPAPRLPVVTAAALAAVLGLVAFLLVPVPDEAGLRSQLAQAAANVTGSARAAPGAYTGRRVDLRNRGKLSEIPLIEVPDDSPVLWRSGVYDTWDGTSWTTPARTRRLTGPPFVVAPRSGPTRTDQVRVERSADGPVWAPGPIVDVELSGQTAIVDEFGSVTGRTRPSYVVTSQSARPDLKQLRVAAGADEDDPTWTALPASVPERVRALGRELTASAPTRIDAVRTVEQWLAARAAYDLDSPVPGPGEDAVDRFLFVDRVGFCEQFAAAEVLLLRSAGIPARFATGLAYGVPSDDGRRTFRQKDLHAWVEVFHPGLGWVASDPTPPSTQLASASLRVRVVATLTSALRRADSLPGGRPAVAAGLLALTAAVAATLLLRRRRPLRDPALPQVVVTGRPGLAAFLRWDARQGAGRRRASETLAELSGRVARPPEVVAAIGVVERELYAASPPADVGAAAAVLDRAGSG